jgi:hypothetical protein
MSQKLCAKTYPLRPAIVRLSLLGAFVLAAVAIGNTGCEDKGIGKTCDVLPVSQGDAGVQLADNQAVFNSQALECPSRICIKPAVDPSKKLPDEPTGALCSASCNQDSDCQTDWKRQQCSGSCTAKCGNDASCLSECRQKYNCTSGDWQRGDQHCVGGFICATPFVKGRLCCKKLCLCQDFLGPTAGQTPIACEGGNAATCYQPPQ